MPDCSLPMHQHKCVALSGPLRPVRERGQEIARAADARFSTPSSSLRRTGLSYSSEKLDDSLAVIALLPRIRPPQTRMTTNAALHHSPGLRMSNSNMRFIGYRHSRIVRIRPQGHAHVLQQSGAGVSVERGDSSGERGCGELPRDERLNRGEPH